MTTCVRILSTASPDSSPSIAIVADNGDKFLIGAGEGCQRCFLEHSQRLSTVRCVCLTHIDHSTLGGLPGLILTAADSSALSDTVQASIDILGPPQTRQWIDSLRHFMRRDKFIVRVHEGERKVQPLSTVKQTKRKRSTVRATVPFDIESIDFWATHAGHKRPRDGAKASLLSFLFTTPAIPGKFQPAKAKALGVPVGSLFGDLKRGQAVTFVDEQGQQRTVESHQVVDEPLSGASVLVLSYASLDHGETILASSRLQALPKQVGSELDLVLHLTPDPTLIGRFKDCLGGDHVFLSTLDDIDIDGTPFRSATTGAVARSHLCSDLYHVPRVALDSDDSREGSLPYVVGRTMMEYTLIPRAKKGFTEPGLPPFDPEEGKKMAIESGAWDMAQAILQQVSIKGDSMSVATEGELVLTGTGSAVPCKYRNVTGMSLMAANGHSFLLDIGEGTIGHLLRLSSRPKQDVLSSIKGVWISHPHADHHLGILRLLHERQADDPLLLIAPSPIFAFLKEFAAVDPAIKNRYVGVDCKELVHDDRNGIGPVAADGLNLTRHQLKERFGWADICSIPVAHCAHAFAVVVSGTPFGRLAYSGDCRPSRRLSELTCDLLIHEATFEDGMEAEATLKRHSTVGEALGVGRNMKAQCIVLTHFSQRYPKIPPVAKSNHDNEDMKIVFAFDSMVLRPHTLHAASVLTPALRLLYPEDDSKKDSSSEAEAILATPGLFANSDIL